MKLALKFEQYKGKNQEVIFTVNELINSNAYQTRLLLRIAIHSGVPHADQEYKNFKQIDHLKPITTKILRNQNR